MLKQTKSNRQTILLCFKSSKAADNCQSLVLSDSCPLNDATTKLLSLRAQS